MYNFMSPFILSILGGVGYSFLFIYTQQVGLSFKKNILRMLLIWGRIGILGFFLYILLKYWPTHSILIIISFLAAFIATTIMSQKS